MTTREELDRLTLPTVGGQAGQDFRATNPFARSVRVDGIHLPTGGIVIAHKLRRKPVGFLVVWAEVGFPQLQVTNADERTIRFLSASVSVASLLFW